MSTRDRIVDAAIRLFNESGSGAVSTNHIARALGMSPGNLYYHFRNKEEIVRAIFDRLVVAWHAAGTLPADRSPTVGDLRRILQSTFATVWEYRFYYRELHVLLRRDPDLARRYRDIRRSGLANIEALLAHFIAAGILRVPDAPGSLPDLARICWMLADYWLPFEELELEPVGPPDLDRGVALILRVLRPHFTDTALAELEQLERATAHQEGVPS